MKRSINIIALLIVAGISLTSSKCNKDNNITGGGKGGNATLVLRAEHGGLLINVNSGTAYIKYGASDIPSNGIYDDSVAFTPKDTISQAVFTGLTNGKYFIQAFGVHIGYPQPNIESVAAITISKQDTTVATLQFSSY